ncbi:MAG: N4-gp56 family major capsid protein [Ruminococcaceae bacterium]|nr:N4-gp56 family major capsid protein [Oscillospiraceae bacterium]
MKKYLFNLQRFAEISHTYTNKTTDVATTVEGVTTGNDLSAENKTYYEKRLITLAEPELVFDQFADKYPIPKNGGKTIEFRKFEPLVADLSATELTEGVTPEGQKLTVGTITAEVHQKGDFVELSDMIELTAIDPMVVQTIGIIGSQAGRVLNKVTRQAITGGTNVVYAPKSNGTAVASRANLDTTCGITLKLIKKCANILKRNNAPKIDGSYICIVHPDIGTDLTNLEGWIDVQKYKNPEKVYEGEIGAYGGVRFIENTECKIWKGTDEANGCAADTAVYACYFIGKGAYATTEVSGGGLQTIVKPLGSGEDPLNQRSTVGWKATKTSEILVQDYLVRLEVCSAESNALATAN